VAGKASRRVAKNRRLGLRSTILLPRKNAVREVGKITTTTTTTIITYRMNPYLKWRMMMMMMARYLYRRPMIMTRMDYSCHRERPMKV